MSAGKKIVYLVDDEPGMVRALTRLLKPKGYDVRGFTSPSRFLEAYMPGEQCCLVLDVAMPEIDGLLLQERLKHLGIMVPIIFLTGHGDIPMTVRAMRAGAADFLTKPVREQDLIRAVNAALDRAGAQRATETLAARLRLLTIRERDVFNLMVSGNMNKEIASALGTGEANIKFHRGNIMKKMKVNSFAELVRLAEKLGIGTGEKRD